MRPELVAAKSAWKPRSWICDLGADALADLVDEVDLEALEGAVLLLVLPRRVRRIGADRQRLRGRRPDGADAERGDGGERRECQELQSHSRSSLIPCSTQALAAASAPAGRTLLASKRRRDAAARLLYVAGLPADAHAHEARWRTAPNSQPGASPTCASSRMRRQASARIRLAGDAKTSRTCRRSAWSAGRCCSSRQRPHRRRRRRRGSGRAPAARTARPRRSPRARRPARNAPCRCSRIASSRRAASPPTAGA